MATKKHHFSDYHPLVVFWVGVLTGAIVVALVFFYRMLAPADYSSSTLRYLYPTLRYPTTSVDTRSLDTSLDSYYSLDSYSLGTATGEYVGMGEPKGG